MLLKHEISNVLSHLVRVDYFDDSNNRLRDYYIAMAINGQECLPLIEEMKDSINASPSDKDILTQLAGIFKGPKANSKMDFYGKGYGPDTVDSVKNILGRENTTPGKRCWMLVTIQLPIVIQIQNDYINKNPELLANAKKAEALLSKLKQEQSQTPQ